jgi:predicted dithiol-disulfide oxidoreductase (DUF899 family)
MRFPGESAEYRAARDRLLREEVELRRRIEEVAALRRALPLGGPVAEDYVFEEGAAELDDVGTLRKVRLSDLFERGKDTLVAYSFMYGPAMEKPCPMCTAMLDSLNGTAPHASQRVNLVVVAKSPLERIRAHARARGWRNLRLLSSAGNTYNRDYHADAADGSQNPILNVFVKRDGEARHFYATELFFAKTELGQNPRHVDSIWPLWNLFDFTPEGRGEDWYPRLSY